MGTHTCLIKKNPICAGTLLGKQPVLPDILPGSFRVLPVSQQNGGGADMSPSPVLPPTYSGSSVTSSVIASGVLPVCFRCASGKSAGSVRPETSDAHTRLNKEKRLCARTLGRNSLRFRIYFR